MEAGLARKISILPVGGRRGSGRRWIALGVLLPLFASACEDGSGPSAGPPAIIVATNGDAQTGEVGTALAVSPGVQVRDAGGNPVQGQPITFGVSGGGGHLSGSSTSTDSNGFASAGTWTLGNTAGPNSLLVAAGTATLTLTATARAGAPAVLNKRSGDGQSAPAGSAVSNAPTVEVRDRFGNPLSGQVVSFAVVSGGGSVTPASTITDATGAAAASWTLGSALGTNTLSASVGSLPTITFTAFSTVGSPTQLEKAAGDSQTAAAGTDVAVSPAVIVRDRGNNPLTGITVTFRVTGGGGSVTGATATTNLSGIATVGSWRMGAVPGPNTLSAEVPNLTPVVFSATAQVGAPSLIEVNAGQDQSATVGTPVAVSPSVIVRDAQRNPVPNVAVTFAVTAGGGTITGASAITNGAGVAGVGSWTLGLTAGANTLRASAGTLGVSINATGVAGPATGIVKVSGDNQKAPPNQTLANPVSVRVVDAHGNPVAGAAVGFTPAQGSGTVSSGLVSTSAAGTASVQWTMGQTVGPATLSVSAQNLAPVSFSANVDCRADYALGQSVSGTLAVGDCFSSENSNYRMDYYAFSLAGQTAVRASMTAPNQGINPDLYVFPNAAVLRPLYAANDDSIPGVRRNSVIRMLLPAGAYLLGATSIGGELGGYTISTSAESASFAGCPAVYNQWFVAQDVSTTQTLDSGDCRAVTSPAGTYFEDRVRIWLQAGTTYVIEQTSTVVDAFLELYLGGQSVASNDNGGGGTNARIVFTPQGESSGFYEIRASNRVQFQGGGYRLTIR